MVGLSVEDLDAEELVEVADTAADRVLDAVAHVIGLEFVLEAGRMDFHCPAHRSEPAPTLCPLCAIAFCRRLALETSARPVAIAV